MACKIWPHLFFLLILPSCSLTNNFFFSKRESPNQVKINENKYEKEDYLAQVSYYKNFYLTSTVTKEIKLSQENKLYIQKLAEKITYNNELFFEQKSGAEIYLINDNIPFHFSTPGKRIFLSTGLLKKYIKSEK